MEDTDLQEKAVLDLVDELDPLFQGQDALLQALRELDPEAAAEAAAEAASLGREAVLERLRTARTASTAAASSFDPFKASVVRTAPQPVRAESSTDRQLQELQQRRRELEGDPSAVQRATVVIFPSQPSSASSVSPIDEGVSLSSQTSLFDTSSSSSSSNSSSSSSAAGPVPGGLLKKILQVGKEEDAPLTTRAVRELQRLQKERVYSRTLVRLIYDC